MTVAAVPGRPPGTVLLTLALLGVVALLGAGGRSRYPLGVLVVTVAGCAFVAWYDNGWRLDPRVGFWDTAMLALTLAIVPFALAAVAGFEALRRRPVAAVVALVVGTGWIGAVTLPHLADWGPVPVLVALGAAGTAATAAVRRA